ncbi:gluconate transporter [Lasius niger]|uniref:Gluconate transporter n=1 Tax=Lasius niger TaxID=67767 RepID=A0A0J7KFE9_LASNI|nr:gluconate transporter [Lasius niger]
MVNDQNKEVELSYTKKWISRHEGLWSRFPVKLEKLPIRDSDPRSFISMYIKRWIMKHEGLWNRFPVKLPIRDSDVIGVNPLVRGCARGFIGLLDGLIFDLMDHWSCGVMHMDNNY